jgi:hypothetical protein
LYELIHQKQEKCFKNIELFFDDFCQLDVRSGNKGNKWTVDKIKNDLMNEMERVKNVMSIMPSSVKYSMDYVVNEIMEYFRASQVNQSTHYLDLTKDGQT